MYKKVLLTTWNIIKCFFHCFFGVSFFYKGALCLYDVIRLSILNKSGTYYFTSIGMVEPDFVFLIGILFIGIGVWSIGKGKYISKHLLDFNKTE